MGKKKERAEFALGLIPDEKIKFEEPFDQPVLSTLTIKNTSDARQVYKVKCSDNCLFRIRPVVGMLEKGEAKEVSLTLTLPDATPPNTPHYFLVSYIEAPAQGGYPRGVWDGAKGNEPLKRLKVDFVGGAGDKTGGTTTGTGGTTTGTGKSGEEEEEEEEEEGESEEDGEGDTSSGDKKTD